MKAKLVFVFMLTSPGNMVLRVGMSSIHPSKTTQPIAVTATLAFLEKECKDFINSVSTFLKLALEEI
jgi:hypothetical protein